MARRIFPLLLNGPERLTLDELASRQRVSRGEVLRRLLVASLPARRSEERRPNLVPDRSEPARTSD